MTETQRHCRSRNASDDVIRWYQIGERLDLEALQRALERLVSDMTRLIYQSRGFLIERGIWVGTGRHVFQKELARLIAEGNDEIFDTECSCSCPT